MPDQLNITSRDLEAFQALPVEERKQRFLSMPPEQQPVFKKAWTLWKADAAYRARPGVQNMGAPSSIETAAGVTEPDATQADVLSRPWDKNGEAVAQQTTPPSATSAVKSGLSVPPDPRFKDGVLIRGPKQSPGYMETLNMMFTPEGARGAAQGATAKYGDELNAGTQAGMQRYGQPILGMLGPVPIPMPFPLNAAGVLAEGAGVASDAIERGSMAPFYNYMQSMRSERPAGQLYDEALQSERDANQAAQQRNPPGYMAAQTLSSIPRSIALAGTGFLGSVAQGAAEGVGGSNAELFSAQTAKEAGVGGAVGAAGHVIGAGVGKVVGGLGRVLLDRAAKLQLFAEAAERSGKPEAIAAVRKMMGETLDALKALKEDAKPRVSPNVPPIMPIKPSTTLSAPPTLKTPTTPPAAPVPAAASPSANPSVLGAIPKLKPRAEVPAAAAVAKPEPALLVSVRDAAKRAEEEAAKWSAEAATKEEARKAAADATVKAMSAAARKKGRLQAIQLATKAESRATREAARAESRAVSAQARVEATRKAVENAQAAHVKQTELAIKAAEQLKAKTAERLMTAEQRAAAKQLREQQTYLNKKAAFDKKEALFAEGEASRQIKLKTKIDRTKLNMADQFDELRQATVKASPFNIGDGASKFSVIQAAKDGVVGGGITGTLLGSTKLFALLGLSAGLIRAMKDPRGAATVARTLARVTRARQMEVLGPPATEALVAALTRGLVNNGSKGFFETWNAELKKNPKLAKVIQLRVENEDDMDKLIPQMQREAGGEEHDFDALSQLVDGGVQ